MTNINKLQKQMQYDSILITDTHHIYYYIGKMYHVDERFIGLLVPKEGEAVLFLNALFNTPENTKTVLFKDGDDIHQLIIPYLQSNTLGVDGNAKLRFILPFMEQGIKVMDCSDDLNAIRAIKDSVEISKMIKASASNDAIMKELSTHFEYGISEEELTDIAVQLQSRAPQTGVSFDPIVVFTENAADPHAVASERTLKHGDTILVDMGGMLDGYASDMTRVFFTDPTSKLKELYEIVLKANEAAINAVKVGVPLSTVDKAARDVITKAGYGEYFTHRTGHGIGQETHEPLDVSEANDTIIQAGMCFSIEPGIYIKDFGGIRIEDLVCVQEDKTLVLNSAPKQFEDIVLNLKEV